MQAKRSLLLAPEKNYEAFWKPFYILWFFCDNYSLVEIITDIFYVPKSRFAWKFILERDCAMVGEAANTKELCLEQHTFWLVCTTFPLLTSTM